MTSEGATPPVEPVGTHEIWALVWQGHWLIVGLTLGVTLAVTCAAYLLPREYEATVLVMPVQSESSAGRLGSLASGASQIGGLAALAGLTAPDEGQRAEAIATLQSELLTERYIQQNDLLKVLFKKKWDAAHGRWKTNDLAAVPTLWKANRYFKSDVRTVTESVRTGMATLTITWTDPVQAAKWANDLVHATNEYLRDKAIADSDRNIAYLESQAQRTTVVGVQQAIYSLAESEIKKSMLAKGREEFALKVIDPAMAPEKQSFPLPALWIPAAFFAGLLLSVFLTVIRGPRPT